MKVLVDSTVLMTAIYITNALWLSFYALHLWIHHKKDRNKSW